MADGINVNIGADTRSFDQAVKAGMIDPLEDAQKTLEELGTGAAGDHLTDTLRDQQRQTTVLKDDIKDLNRTIADGARSSQRAQSASSHQATRDVSEGFDEMKDSARSNAIETAASFDGSFQSIAGGAQGLASEFLAAFGPAGMLAGIGIASLIGTITTSMDNAQAATEAEKAEIGGLTDALIEAGATGHASLGQVTDTLRAMATQSDSSQLSLGDVKKQADDLGLSFREYAQAIATGGKPLDAAIAKVQQLRSTEAMRLHDMNQGMEGIEWSPLLAGYDAQISKLQKTKREQDSAQTATEVWAETGAAALQAQSEATQSYADSVEGAMQSAGSSFEKFTKKGKVNLDHYNDSLEDSVQAITDYQENMVTASQTLSQNALNYIESLGQDAAPLLQAYVDAPNGMKTRTAANWDALGSASGAAYTEGLKAGIPNSVPGPVVTPYMAPISQADLDRARGEAQRYLDAHPLRAGAVAYTRNGKPLWG